MPNFDEAKLAEIKARQDAEERERREMAAAQLKASREQALSGSGMSVRHRQQLATVDRSGPWGEAWGKVEPRVGTGCLLALVGTRGSGKTQIGCCAIEHRVNASQLPQARYVRAMDVFMAIRESYRKDGPSEAEQVAQFERPEILVIDECQERGESDWENRMFTRIIDGRYAHPSRADLDTILISNLTPEAFADSIGPSTYSRLQEIGGIIECNWPSFRGKRGDG